MKFKLLLLASFLSVGLMITACGGGDEDAADMQDTTAVQPAETPAEPTQATPAATDTDMNADSTMMDNDTSKADMDNDAGSESGK